MLAIAGQCSVFARQTEVGRPPPFPSQSFFPPERRSFQRRVDCHLSKGARYTNIRCHAVPLAAKFRLLQATVGIRLRRKHKGTH
jgi:hypothetical protein